MSFKRLDPEDISISAESVVAPLFSNGAKALTSLFTSSNQVASSTGNFFYQVFHQNPNVTSTAATAQVQFSIAFGDKTGRGTEAYNSNITSKSPSSTIYGQYRNLVLGDEEEDIKFGEVAQDYFYAISVNGSRYKEKLLPGSFNLELRNDQTSPNTTLRLTDNSQDVSTVSFTDAGRVFEIVSGSDGSAVSTSVSTTGFTTSAGSYGKFLPDVGVILLNGAALDAAPSAGGLSLSTGLTANTDGKNKEKLFGVMTFDTAGAASASLQSEETVSSNFVFVRVRNSEYNYSTNPSNITGSGELRHDVMINTPQAYITTIGLYNDSNDLLAIAKLSRPLLKDFTKEALVRIKLDY